MFPPLGMMGMPMMGMPGIGMPVPMPMPMMAPTPGVVPGMPGMGYYNSLPGRFGRDMLGRDFAGPGGIGSSQPYRPPDPSALPPMPFGLPFIARPGQEGFDAYGRMLPPELPEGWDGWGRPIVAGAVQPNPAPPPNIGPNGNLAASPAGTPIGPGGGPMPPPPAPGTRDMPLTSVSGSGTMASNTGTSSGTSRPDQPACFERPPAPSDSYYRYADFEAFSLPSHALNHPWELHLPRELVSHDVTEEDWTRFIDDLAKESVQSATHDWGKRNRGVLGRGPNPVLTDSVHSLLLSWAVAFFAPRGIKIYAASEGRRILPPPLDPTSSRGTIRADEWSDTESDLSDTEWEVEERQARRNDMYLPRRERELRRGERARQRRRDRRRRLERERREDLEIGREREGGSSRGGAGSGWDGVGGRGRRGEWEVHFVCVTPTLWTPGARPRTYGEPVARARR